MSDTVSSPVASIFKLGRAALLVAGLSSLIFGILILVWPTKTAVVVTGLLAIQVLISGIFYLALGLGNKELSTGGRVGHSLLGVLYIVGGIVAFFQLQAAAAVLAVFIAIMIGVLWVIEGFVSLFSLGKASSKVWTVIFAIISIIAGFTLLSSPLWSALFLWWLLAIGLIVMGVLNVFRALFTDRGASE
ncbi:MAG TPA: DUF308 domain-containing protein [Arachnia sp.]|nr:DUF308 domain-containing protein [Arachnia sp.]HMT84985.1 DUF308 domain-containing protein [Arachnia sp.]